jgi:hypothetical protein
MELLVISFLKPKCTCSGIYLESSKPMVYYLLIPTDGGSNKFGHAKDDMGS